MGKKTTGQNIVSKKGLVVFVEGQMEEVFYDIMIKHLIGTSSEVPIGICKVENVKGVGNYTLKAPNIFKNQILRDYPDTIFSVICAYDSDVFEFSPKPPVNWKIAEKRLKEYGAKKVTHIKAVRMIEDWFLMDMDGLCRYLGLTKVPKIKGNTGFKKISDLFEKRNRIYVKGSQSDFQSFLNYQLLYNKLEKELSPLRKLLFVN